jgi:hypothetical protein
MKTIVLAQRYTNCTPSEDFGRQVVEALVFQSEGGAAWTLRSLFYDPNQGQSVQTPFRSWDRGTQSYTPLPNAHVMNLLTSWSIPDDTPVGIDHYTQCLHAYAQAFAEGIQNETARFED